MFVRCRSHDISPRVASAAAQGERSTLMIESGDFCLLLDVTRRVVLTNVDGRRLNGAFALRRPLYSDNGDVARAENDVDFLQHGVWVERRKLHNALPSETITHLWRNRMQDLYWD
jgi:hypothetical protein